MKPGPVIKQGFGRWAGNLRSMMKRMVTVFATALRQASTCWLGE